MAYFSFFFVCGRANASVNSFQSVLSRLACVCDESSGRNSSKHIQLSMNRFPHFSSIKAKQLCSSCPHTLSLIVHKLPAVSLSPYSWENRCFAAYFGEAKFHTSVVALDCRYAISTGVFFFFCMHPRAPPCFSFSHFAPWLLCIQRKHPCDKENKHIRQHWQLFQRQNTVSMNSTRR